MTALDVLGIWNKIFKDSSRQGNNIVMLTNNDLELNMEVFR